MCFKKMPFISKDWRSPGEEWVKTQEGWEKKKVLECTAQRWVALQNKQQSFVRTPFVLRTINCLNFLTSFYFSNLLVLSVFCDLFWNSFPRILHCRYGDITNLNNPEENQQKWWVFFFVVVYTCDQLFGITKYELYCYWFLNAIVNASFILPLYNQHFFILP